MKDQKLADFTVRNKINPTDLERALYSYILENIFQSICEYIKLGDNEEMTFRKEYFARANKTDSIKAIVRWLCKIELSDEEAEQINTWVKARLSKKDRRMNLAQIGKTLYESGQNTCQICGKPLSPTSYHVDHIIPWDYVGDELEGNYQLLCKRCNLLKSNRTGTNIKRIVFKGV